MIITLICLHFLVIAIPVGLIILLSTTSNSSHSLTLNFFGAPSQYVVPFTVVNNKVLGKMAIGKPKKGENVQVMNIYVNPNSALTWIHSVDLCENRNCDTKPFKAFDGTKSETYRKGDTKIELKQNSDSFSGFICEDQFKFGTSWSSTVVDMQFLEVTQKSFSYDGYDGSLGLDLKVGNTQYQHEPVIWKMLKQLPEPTFGFYMYNTPKPNEYGKFVVGGKDNGYMFGHVRSHDVIITQGDKYSGWNIVIEKIIVTYRDGSRKELETSVKVASPAPGTQDIVLPSADTGSLLKLIFESLSAPVNGKTFSCENGWKSLPTVSLVMSGFEYVLNPVDYVRSQNGVECVVAVEEAAGPSKILLGRTFMKKFYTRYHIGNKQLQFARARPSLW